MQLPPHAFTLTDWAHLPPTERPGQTGKSLSRTQTIGDLRVRMVEYSPGYASDHWCSKGHILLCLDGELETTLQGGPTFLLKPGMSYQVGDGDPPHRSSTVCGAKLFIVD